MISSRVVFAFLVFISGMFALGGLCISLVWNAIVGVPHLSWSAGIIVVILLSFIGSVFKK